MTLTQIALQMRREARQEKRARQPLERGLILTLWRDGEDWILSLTRKEVPASQQEIETCQKYFEIPAETKAEPEPIKGYHVTRLRWSDDDSKSPKGDAAPEQVSFEGGEAEGKLNYYRESL